MGISYMYTYRNKFITFKEVIKLIHNDPTLHSVNSTIIRKWLNKDKLTVVQVIAKARNMQPIRINKNSKKEKLTKEQIATLAEFNRIGIKDDEFRKHRDYMEK